MPSILTCLTRISHSGCDQASAGIISELAIWLFSNSGFVTHMFRKSRTISVGISTNDSNTASVASISPGTYPVKFKYGGNKILLGVRYPSLIFSFTSVVGGDRE